MTHSIRKFLIQAGIISLGLTSTSVFAVQEINLRNQPINILDKIQSQNFVLKGATVTPPLTFKEKMRDIDFNQTMHIRMQQYVGDAPVLGGDFVMHIPKIDKQMTNKPLAFLMKINSINMNGVIYDNLLTDLQSVALSHLNDVQKQNALAHAIQLSHYNAQQITNVQNKLVVYIDENKKAHWAYVVNFIINDRAVFAKPSFILDAVTLEPYKEWNDVRGFENVEAGGKGGNYRTGELIYDYTPEHLPGFIVQREPLNNTCYMRNDKIVLRDVLNNLDVDEFSCPAKIAKYNHLYWNKDSYTNGAQSPANDIMFAATETIKMYQDWYQTSVWTDETGKSKPIVFWIHDQRPYSWSSDGWKDYSGTIDDKYIRLGDGDTEYFPFSTLDIVAHEISHGFTYEHANFESDWRDSTAAAIDESFSDMAAKTVEDYVYHANANWNIGRVFKDEKRWLRYMEHPAQDCQWRQYQTHECSIENVDKYEKQLSARFASGIFNRAFYLMATSPGSSTRKAFDAMMQANRHYWTSKTTFCEAARNVAQAAVDVHLDVEIVKSAFKQVGIDVTTCK